MKESLRKSWVQILLILFAAMILTRSSMALIEAFTSNWYEHYNVQLWRNVAKKTENMQMKIGDSDPINENGCFRYYQAEEVILSYCISLDSDSITIIKRSYRENEFDGFDELTIAKSLFDPITGVRRTNIGYNEIESNILELGAELSKNDEEYWQDENGDAATGLRWFQAVMGSVRKMNRTNVLMNGWIQMFIYLFSGITVVLLWLVLISIKQNRENQQKVTILNNPIDEDGTVDRTILHNDLQTLADIRQTTNQNEEIEPLTTNDLLEPSLKNLLKYDEVDHGALLTSVEAFGHGVQERLERRFLIIRYFVTAIPSLGFIGTIVGISQALGQTSALTGESLPHERIFANETLGQSLYIAFDTTLVALVLSIILSFMIDWVENREVSFVIDLRKQILHRFSLIKALK